MIVAYFDESSDDKRQRHIAIGGIIGHELGIDFFESNWIKETAGLEEPFRSTDCETQHGQFTNWEKSECDDLMRRLVGVTTDQRANIGHFAFDVPIQMFREVFPGEDEEAPVRLAVAHTIVEMARLARKHNETIRLWFEDGPFHSLIDNTYRSLKSLQSWKPEERSRLFGISFDDKTLVPLQAADLVAREGFKIVDNIGQRPLRKPVERMWGRMAMGRYSREALGLLKQKGWPENLEAIVSLPDDCYVRELPTDGRQYFERQ